MSINTAENGERWEEVCEDHWHCNPYLASHNCYAVNRTRPCPTCKKEPQPRGAHGWPLVPSMRWRGEMALSCPRCGDTNITMTVAYGPGGVAGMPGATDIVRCRACGHADYKPATWKP